MPQLPELVKLVVRPEAAVVAGQPVGRCVHAPYLHRACPVDRFDARSARAPATSGRLTARVPCGLPVLPRLLLKPSPGPLHHPIELLPVQAHPRHLDRPRGGLAAAGRAPPALRRRRRRAAPRRRCGSHPRCFRAGSGSRRDACAPSDNSTTPEAARRQETPASSEIGIKIVALRPHSLP